MAGSIPALMLVIAAIVSALGYDENQALWNLNQNVNATAPVDYWGEWHNHTFHPSPVNWRFPFYSLSIDRFVDGDPTNDNANGTRFEHSWTSNQFRFGGDARGLQQSLDYLHGMGIKGLYLTGSPFINLPWAGDGYGPLDFTLLDHHHGTIEDWRNLVTAIHERDMYVILDNTLATMGDLIGFEGYLNSTTPFSWNEYGYEWKGSRQYHDFTPNNSMIETCEYPRFWGQDGYPTQQEMSHGQHACYDSDFDQYGDMPGVGAVPTWQSQLAKFASTQDRLRIWRADVIDRLKVMSCMQIAMLDIDGFRMDKALQTPLDSQVEWASYQRDCARRYGKNNFFITGETVGEPPFAAVYMGRGKQPDMYFENITEAQLATNQSSIRNSSAYLRGAGSSALDSAAFHYPTYGALTRFLGLSGLIGSEGEDWSYHWRKLLERDDMVNAETGEFDPRHMFGTTNQDVFRWPALTHGLQRQSLGFLVTQMLLPGIPLLLWGEEQAFYVLENLATDYVFGRMPMASQRAWQLHGCYQLSETGYYDQPFNSSRTGCHDDSVSLDHRDPSHPARNLLKRMYQLRQEYPVLNDGYTLRNLSNLTYEIFLPGSANIPSELGVWSVYRGRTEGVQDFTGVGSHGNQGVWFVYMNENSTKVYDFNCSDYLKALTSPFAAGTRVKNLFYPYDEYTLQASRHKLGIEGSQDYNGCLSQLAFKAWGFKAFVPIRDWREPMPSITRVIPQHDARLLASVPLGGQDTVQLEIRFSSNMSCESVTNNLKIHSTTQDGVQAQLDRSSISCHSQNTDVPELNGAVATSWIWTGSLSNVSHGIHTYTISNATTDDAEGYTNALDRFMFRLGGVDNAMVFPLSSNYTANMLSKDNITGRLSVKALAAGADLYQYSTDWGSTFSPWLTYTGKPMEIQEQVWRGTRSQKWDGTHAIIKYWSEAAGSADHVQHTDLEERLPRRWPHAFVAGSWNQWGSDHGLKNHMKQSKTDSGLWSFDLAAEWPTQVGINVWGMNSDGTLDLTAAYGDVDGDHVLDWLPPNTKSNNVVNMTERPPLPHLGWRLVVNDADLSYSVQPVGSAWSQLIVGLLLGLVPVITAFIGVWAFRKSYYNVHFNTRGETAKRGLIPTLRHSLTVLEGLRPMRSLSSSNGERSRHSSLPSAVARALSAHADTSPAHSDALLRNKSRAFSVAADLGAPARRTTLIATMEYEIEDWSIKVKIGGLGVMSSLMGKSLSHQDLIWVVPCVGDMEYPVDTPAEPVMVKVLDHVYRIYIQYHQLRNITFVLLDAPVFRRQTKAEPYPARMDDLDSAIYYSAWNACIAEMIRRFEPDLYHINDYHGALAALYLLPATIPVSLSLHNAEFQGMWPLRTRQEMEEVSDTFNLDEKVIKKYVQFGEVFNMLHAAASYLRVHQGGFGAVGVSKKYGGRSWARYPIFWGLSKIGSLPNPDPSDTLPWDPNTSVVKEAPIDLAQETQRGVLRCQAQEWAGLNVDPEADLFVFVGRWSMQKGVDLIADVFFPILGEFPKTQLICIGPVIDLYGKFAALKLEKMMAKYPGRVFSKPEFTTLPPYVFSGAEFALIPSRDEPFGLVAVEAGRNGALGVGARVGGLGQMPGWWYTIESASTRHLLQQFNMAIVAALGSSQKVRAQMRAYSALQRFPVAQWVEDLELLQTKSIKKHNSHRRNNKPHSWSQSFVSWVNPARSPRTANPETAFDMDMDEKIPEDEQDTTVLFSDVRFSGPGRKRHADAHGRRSSFDTMHSTDAQSLRLTDSDSIGPHRRRSVESMELGPKEGRRRISFVGPDRGSLFRSSKHKMLTRDQCGQGEGDDDSTNEAPAVQIRDFANLPIVASEKEHTGDSQGERAPRFRRLEFGDFTNETISEVDEDVDGADSQLNSENEVDSNDEKVDHEDMQDVASQTSNPTDENITRLNSDSTATTLSNSSMSTEHPHAQGDAEDVDPMFKVGDGSKMGTSKDNVHSSHHSSHRSAYTRGRDDKRLSLRQVRGVENATNYNLQRVIPSFTDRKGSYAYKFGELLENVDAQSSVNALCIEDYLKNSEKHFFGKYARARLGLSHTTPSQQPSTRPQEMEKTSAPIPPPLPSSPSADIGAGKRPTLHRIDVPSSPDGSPPSDGSQTGPCDIDDTTNAMASGRRDTVFNLGKDYVAPRGIPQVLQRKVVGDWQVYAFLLALGHILSANSYQITLLQGHLGQTTTRAYVIGSIYLSASVGWWVVFRVAQSRYVLSLPWFFYGLAFFLIGMGPCANYLDGTRGWLFSCATGFYTVAAASGSLFFSLNFGTEGGTPVSTWVLRAAIIQGIQQLYVAGLWRAGASLNEINARTGSGDGDKPTGLLTSNSALTAVTVPIAVVLWTVGVLLFVGLPTYYRQRPGHIPSFYTSLLRRKVVLWFFVSVVLQNYFLSTVYGRNWRYLFSSQHAPAWAVGLMMVGFFVGVWAAVMYCLYVVSAEHSWVPPVLGVCLGAPRWCQELWAVSGVAAFVPWGATDVGGAMLGRALWLWLGVLDELQGVGLGMILLQTLPRFHVAATLVACQVVGSLATIVARAGSPVRRGPGDVFPNFAVDPTWGLTRAWFWVGLTAQIVVCVGFLKFFRREQLFKP